MAGLAKWVITHIFYSGAVRACVTTGRKYFRYLLVPEGDALCVYRCVQESTRVEVQE